MDSSVSLPVRIAVAGLRYYLEEGRMPHEGSPPIALLLNAVESGNNTEEQELLAQLRTRSAGVFVSYHERTSDDLRGCIGTISATTDTVLAEICRNTISAGTEDPRFPPIGLEELDSVPGLRCKVDVLGAAEPVGGFDELDVKRYGVIVSKGRRRGLLLPDLEGVDTVEYQVAIALSKAGISPKDSYELERFEVIRYE